VTERERETETERESERDREGERQRERDRETERQRERERETERVRQRDRETHRPGWPRPAWRAAAATDRRLATTRIERERERSYLAAAGDIPKHAQQRVFKRPTDPSDTLQALHYTQQAIDAFEKGLAIDGDNAALHAGIMQARVNPRQMCVNPSQVCVDPNQVCSPWCLQAIADACAWDKKERYLPKVLASMKREVQTALQHGANPHPLRDASNNW
jgi:hypothetical protein